MEVLNDAFTSKAMSKIDHQPQLLYGMFDSQEFPKIDEIQEQEEETSLKTISNPKNFKDFRQLFLEEEFVDLVDLIMENTFFNII